MPVAEYLSLDLVAMLLLYDCGTMSTYRGRCYESLQ